MRLALRCLRSYLQTSLALALLAACGFPPAADEAVAPGQAPCERSAYELERTRYRCTSAGELQTLDCGEWDTLAVCETAEA